ncbi:MAG: hypothetical protein ACXVBZ_12030 [Flavisolibacter sp.]
MKRVLFLSALFVCLSTLPSFASATNIPGALQSFFKTFRNAQNVNWTEVDDMLRVGFILDGQQEFAYYSNDELVVVAKEIKTEALPESLRTQLGQYSGYTVAQVFELDNNNSKEYCVMLESPSKHITLKGKTKWTVCFDEKIG